MLKYRHKKVARKNRFSQLLQIAAALILLAAAGLLLTFIFVAKDLPRPERFAEREIFQTSRIYNRAGQEVLYTIFGEEKRDIKPLSHFPDYVQKAVIAAEDGNFYEHFGLDWRGIARSIWLNLKTGQPIFGGSTISQQLIRSSFLSQEKTLARKAKELILTLELERRYSKEQILEWYLNQVPFGQNAYGLEAASQTYFGKSAKDLSIAEATTLASLIQAPSRLSPYGQRKQELLGKKDLVLKRMRQKGFIEQKDYEQAKKHEITFREIRNPIKAPHFTLYVRELLEQEFGPEFLEQKGLKIYTTLDWELQQKAEELVKKYSEVNKSYRAHNAALVALDPKTGQVLALVGSKDWFGQPSPKGCKPGIDCLFDPKVNVTTSLPGRQPGSAFKPFVYAAAFEKGYTDKHIVIDEPTNFGAWGGKPYMPRNYDDRFRGPVTLRQALAQSLNVPSVKVFAYFAGVEDGIKKAKEMGISTLDKPGSFYGLALVLGGGEVKLLDMVSSYGVLAYDGVRMPANFILKIEDAKGNIIKKQNSSLGKRVLPSQTARLITDVLSDNVARAPIFGPNSPLDIKEFQAAVKTGTTNDFKDGWAIGYTAGLAVGVWAGNNNGTPMLKEPGVVVAAPLWREFLIEASKKYPASQFSKPEI